MDSVGGVSWGLCPYRVEPRAIHTWGGKKSPPRRHKQSRKDSQTRALDHAHQQHRETESRGLDFKRRKVI